MKTQLLLLIGLLGGLELVARLAQEPTPSAAEVVSNPAGRRHWPEYLRTPPSAKPLIILISNSQAQGLDVANPAQRYVGLMQAQLAPAGVELQNWSSEGILTGEIEILTVEVMRRRPVLVVYVLGLSNFDREQQVSLSRAGSDIGILAGNPLLWPALSPTLLWKNSRAHDIAQRTLFSVSALARLRLEVEDRIGLALPKDWQKQLFGRVLDLRPSIHPPPMGGDAEAVIRDAAALKSGPVAEAAAVADVAALIARERQGATRVLWVWMPAAIGITRPELLRHARDLAEVSNPLLGNVRDLSTEFSDAEFLTQFHLNAAGHRHMAETLLPIVLDALR